MRNQPVTQREFDYPADEILMSATDLKGRIIYANPAFARVSKYLPSEMVGQPHNMVRHPDVPAAAYKDLWENLEQGHFWTGILKNRCSDGDHYWVRANVTPVFQDGRLTGYVSVRTKPSREEVAEAEVIYRQFAEGRPRVSYANGQLVRRGLPGLLDRLRMSSLRTQLWGMLGAVLAVWTVLELTFQIHDGLWWQTLLPGIVGCLVVGALVDYRFVRRLKPVMRQAAQAATGQPLDTRRLATLDEAGLLQRAIIQANLNQHTFIADVDRLIKSLDRAAGEIAEDSQHLSAQADTAANRLNDTAQAMEEMADTVERNARSTQEATGLARAAGESTTRAAALVQGTAEHIEKMHVANQKIGGIVDTINSLAFQTNILALNANVEAARAGDAGRGFAVVAGEVRSLAQRSATSAREIGDIIHEVVELVQGSAEQAEKAVDAMRDMRTQNTKVGQLIERIADAGRQQAQGLERIQHSVTELNQLTQSNATLAGQSSTAVLGMKDQIRVLAKAVDIFHHKKSTKPAARTARNEQASAA